MDSREFGIEGSTEIGFLWGKQSVVASVVREKSSELNVSPGEIPVKGFTSRI